MVSPDWDFAKAEWIVALGWPLPTWWFAADRLNADKNNIRSDSGLIVNVFSEEVSSRRRSGDISEQYKLQTLNNKNFKSEINSFIFFGMVFDLRSLNFVFLLNINNMNTIQDITIRTPFEKLVFVRKAPYWLFWIVLGSIIFITGEIMIIFFKESHFLVFQILCCLGVAILPVINVLLHKQFIRLKNRIRPMFETSDDEWDLWVSHQEVQVFTLKNANSKFIVGTFIALSCFTVWYLGIPFISMPLSLFTVLAMLIFFFICGMTLHITIKLLIFLKELSDLKVDVPFLMLPSIELTNIQRFYSAISIFIAISYISAVFIIWFGPYGFNPQTLSWLSFSALLPITVFIWSYLHIHLIRHKVKISFVQVVNQYVNIALQSLEKNNEKDQVEKLDLLISLQFKVQGIKEYPFEIGGLVTFILTTLIAIIQFALSFQQITK